MLYAMGRTLRVDAGNIVYHVINRGNFRSALFGDDREYAGFMNILAEVKNIVPMRILAYCLMPNHWHLVLYPENDKDLSRFMQLITLTHTQRYHTKTDTRGYGHLYQGRYKSFPVQNDSYFLNLAGYVERNAKRAGLVGRAEDWKWSSAHVRMFGNDVQRELLSPWPISMDEDPENYARWLNECEPQEEIEHIRRVIRRNRPYGSELWTAEMVESFHLGNTIRVPGRPKNKNGT